MKKARPPLLAGWILEHFCSSSRNRELLGDLHEEFLSGRTPGWYWRQTLSAIGSGMLREFWRHRLALLFAAVWTALAPTMWFFLFGFIARRSGSVWHISYPGTVLFAEPAVVLVQIWMGIAIYAFLLSCLERNSSLERIGRGLWLGPCMFVLIGFPRLGLAMPLMAKGHLVRLLPYLLGMVAAVWPIKASSRPAAIQRVEGS